MKKAVIILAAISITTGAFAQKAKIYSAKEFMDDGDMKKAVANINEAVTSESTKMDGDAWFVRGIIYEKLAATDPTAVEESAKSFMKVLEVKPGYDKDKIVPRLMRIRNIAFNAGVGAYQANAKDPETANYDLAISSFQKVIDIYNINGGAYFASDKDFDTVASRALKYQGFSLYNAKKYDQALTVLNKVKNKPAAREAYVYSVLIDLYTANKDNAAIEKTLEEAKSLYPKNADIARQEINYYAESNRTEILVKKMEEAVKTDPDNPVLQFNLGVLYSKLANPKDAADKPKEKPANSKELESKAEMAYKMAIDADPSKAEYVFNLGALYFNNAADIATKMGALGQTEADNKKYDALKVLRTAEYTKGLKYFQSAYDLLKPKAAKMNEEDMGTYRGTLLALQTIYDDLGQIEKSDEKGKELAALSNPKQ